MRRRELIRRIARAAKQAGLEWAQVRASGRHEVWSCDGLLVVVPKHLEINEYTAQGIFRELEEKLGEDWWR